MSTDSAVDGAKALRTRRVLRLAFGVTLSAAIALGIGWPLSFLVPVLIAGLLAAPAPCPTLKSGAALVLTIAVAGVFGLLVSPIAIYYPLVWVFAMGLCLFLVFRASHGGASPFLILWLLIALLLIPMVAQQSMLLAQEITQGLVFGGLVAILLTWLMHALLPDPPGVEYARPAEAGGAIEPLDRDRLAALSTLVVQPVAIVFYTLGLSSDLLVLVFIAILAQQSNLAAGRKAGTAMLTGNLLGGIVAIVFYNLLVAAPSFGFFVSLMLLAALVLGTRIFSGRPEAPIYSTALSTVLVLIGGSVAPMGEDVDAKFSTRIIQITIASLYIVGTFGLLEKLVAIRSNAEPERGRVSYST